MYNLTFLNYCELIVSVIYHGFFLSFSVGSSLASVTVTVEGVSAVYLLLCPTLSGERRAREIEYVPTRPAGGHPGDNSKR